MTPLNSNDPDEVLDWTPAEEDEEVTEWNPTPPIENPPIVNPPWVPYYVDWQPPPPAETDFRRIVDLDEFKNGTSDLIDPNIQDDDEDIHIQYIENSPGTRSGNRRSKKLRDRSRRREERDADDLHKIDEHPLTTSQAEKMKDTIDEEIFPEIPPPEDDDEDPWKNIEKEINERHLIKNSVYKKAQTWDEWYTECDAVPYQTYVTIRKETENESEPEVTVKKIKLRITSDLDPPLSPSSDETHDDPPYHGVPPERPAAPPPRCDIPPPPIVPAREMWYKVKELYDKYTLQDRRNQLGQYELRDLLESCGYNDRFREASFLFQYYRFAKFYEEIFMRQVAPPAQVQHQAQTTSSSSSSSGSTSWDRAMSSLSQVAAASTLPPVDEHADDPDLDPPDERDDDPDLGPPDDSPELTQSEAETNVFQPEVNASQETSSPEHEPNADAGAGDVPAPPPGPSSRWSSPGHPSSTSRTASPQVAIRTGTDLG